MIMKKSAFMLLIILLSLTANAQTPYHNEDGKKIDKEELETKDYLPEIHGTIRTKFEYQTEMAASRFEVRNARISITGNVDRKSTRLNSSHRLESRMPSSA